MKASRCTWNARAVGSVVVISATLGRDESPGICCSLLETGDLAVLAPDAMTGL